MENTSSSMEKLGFVVYPPGGRAVHLTEQNSSIAVPSPHKGTTKTLITHTHSHTKTVSSRSKSASSVGIKGIGKGNNTVNNALSSSSSSSSFQTLSILPGAGEDINLQDIYRSRQTMDKLINIEVNEINDRAKSAVQQYRLKLATLSFNPSSSSSSGTGSSSSSSSSTTAAAYPSSGGNGNKNKDHDGRPSRSRSASPVHRYNPKMMNGQESYRSSSVVNNDDDDEDTLFANDNGEEKNDNEIEIVPFHIKETKQTLVSNFFLMEQNIMGRKSQLEGLQTGINSLIKQYIREKRLKRLQRRLRQMELQGKDTMNDTMELQNYRSPSPLTPLQHVDQILDQWRKLLGDALASGDSATLDAVLDAADADNSGIYELEGSDDGDDDDVLVFLRDSSKFPSAIASNLNDALKATDTIVNRIREMYHAVVELLRHADERMTAALQNIQNQLLLAYKEMESLKEQLQKQVQTTELIQRRCYDLEKDKHKLTDSITVLQEKITMLELQLRESHIQNDVLIAQIEELRKQLNEANMQNHHAHAAETRSHVVTVAPIVTPANTGGDVTMAVKAAEQALSARYEALLAQLRASKEALEAEIFSLRAQLAAALANAAKPVPLSPKEPTVIVKTVPATSTPVVHNNNNDEMDALRRRIQELEDLLRDSDRRLRETDEATRRAEARANEAEAKNRKLIAEQVQALNKSPSAAAIPEPKTKSNEKPKSTKKETPSTPTPSSLPPANNNDEELARLRQELLNARNEILALQNKLKNTSSNPPSKPTSPVPNKPATVAETVVPKTPPVEAKSNAPVTVPQTTIVTTVETVYAPRPQGNDSNVQTDITLADMENFYSTTGSVVKEVEKVVHRDVPVRSSPVVASTVVNTTDTPKARSGMWGSLQTRRNDDNLEDHHNYHTSTTSEQASNKKTTVSDPHISSPTQAALAVQNIQATTQSASSVPLNTSTNKTTVSSVHNHRQPNQGTGIESSYNEEKSSSFIPSDGYNHRNNNNDNDNGNNDHHTHHHNIDPEDSDSSTIINHSNKQRQMNDSTIPSQGTVSPIPGVGHNTRKTVVPSLPLNTLPSHESISSYSSPSMDTVSTVPTTTRSVRFSANDIINVNESSSIPPQEHYSSNIGYRSVSNETKIDYVSYENGNNNTKGIHKVPSHPATHVPFHTSSSPLTLPSLPTNSSPNKLDHSVGSAASTASSSMISSTLSRSYGSGTTFAPSSPLLLVPEDTVPIINPNYDPTVLPPVLREYRTALDILLTHLLTIRKAKDNGMHLSFGDILHRVDNILIYVAFPLKDILVRLSKSLAPHHMRTLTDGISLHNSLEAGNIFGSRVTTTTELTTTSTFSTGSIGNSSLPRMINNNPNATSNSTDTNYSSPKKNIHPGGGSPIPLKGSTNTQGTSQTFAIPPFAQYSIPNGNNNNTIMNNSSSSPSLSRSTGSPSVHMVGLPKRVSNACYVPLNMLEEAGVLKSVTSSKNSPSTSKPLSRFHNY